MNHKALILGTNNTNGLSALRCLGRMGVKTVAVDYAGAHNYGARFRYCSEQLATPHYREDTEGFVSCLLDYADKQDYPPVLIPCHDYYVELIDEHLDVLSKKFLISQTQQGLNVGLMNKVNLHEMAKERAVLVPEVVRPDDPHFKEKVRDTLGYPCLVKPIDSPSFVSRFRVKLFEVNNESELLVALAKAREARLEVFMQRIIPGFDDHMYTFDAYLNQHSEVTHWVTCQKYRQFPINYGASVYLGHQNVPELHEIGKKFLENVGYKGFAEMEFKKDARTGNYYLIEVNVRLTNFDAMLERLGFNVPYITYRELIGSPLDPVTPPRDSKLAFWYLYEDIIAVRQYLKAGQLTLTQVLGSLFRPKVYAVWDWRDPLPGLVFARHTLAKIVSKLPRVSQTAGKGVSQ